MKANASFVIVVLCNLKTFIMITGWTRYKVHTAFSRVGARWWAYVNANTTNRNVFQ